VEKSFNHVRDTCEQFLLLHHENYYLRTHILGVNGCRSVNTFVNLMYSHQISQALFGAYFKFKSEYRFWRWWWRHFKLFTYINLLCSNF